jgi:UPF0755 protein
LVDFFAGGTVLMKTAGYISTLILALVALGVGFAGTTAVLYVTQPASSASTTVRFTVSPGDTTNVVAQRLQDDGLIRSAVAFRLYARFEHLDQGIEPGIYLLNPHMTMKDIIAKIQNGTPDEQLAGVIDALRLTQYPPYFTKLPNFSATDFTNIVKTGVLPDGTKLWTKYWFVEQPSTKVKPYDALEGYLYPDHYYFNNSDNATAVIEKMMLEMASYFCPGPSSNLTMYVDTLNDCKQHAAMIGTTNIFSSMESAYRTKNDTLAMYDTLTIASLTAREIRSLNDAIGVASTFHNRYLVSVGATSDITAQTAGYLGSDPSAQYARDSDSTAKDVKWWAPLADSGRNTDPKNPYNTDANTGLPPGPIANPVWQEIEAAAAPKSPTAWPNFYFVSDKCGKIYYAKDPNGFNTINTVTIPKANAGYGPTCPAA